MLLPISSLNRALWNVRRTILVGAQLWTLVAEWLDEKLYFWNKKCDLLHIAQGGWTPMLRILGQRGRRKRDGGGRGPGWWWFTAGCLCVQCVVTHNLANVRQLTPPRERWRGATLYPPHRQQQAGDTQWGEGAEYIHSINYRDHFNFNAVLQCA